PVTLLGHRRLHLWLVEAERAQRRIDLALHAVVESLDDIRSEVGAASLVAREAQESEDVGAHIVADATHLDVDTGGVRQWPGQQPYGEPGGPPERSTSPRQKKALRHLTRVAGVKCWDSRALCALSLAARRAAGVSRPLARVQEQLRFAGRLPA